MKILKWSAAVVGGLLVIGWVLPDEALVVRSVTIAAPPAAIHPHLDTLRAWPEWSAWNKQADSTVVFGFRGPASGVGALWTWDGKVFSQGQLEILESDPARGMRYVVTMGNGFKAYGDIAFSPGPGGTTLTWTDRMPMGMGPLGGWMKLALGGMITEAQGGSQERSLEGLKKRVEKSAS